MLHYINFMLLKILCDAKVITRDVKTGVLEKAKVGASF